MGKVGESQQRITALGLGVDSSREETGPIEFTFYSCLQTSRSKEGTSVDVYLLYERHFLPSTQSRSEWGLLLRVDEERGWGREVGVSGQTPPPVQVGRPRKEDGRGSNKNRGLVPHLQSVRPGTLEITTREGEG